MTNNIEHEEEKDNEQENNDVDKNENVKELKPKKMKDENKQSEKEKSKEDTSDKKPNESKVNEDDNEEVELNEDEEILNWKNDELIERDYLSSLLQQQDRLVYYEVENIYKDEKKRLYKNKLNLKKDPPVLIVRDENENEVRFYLTENLTDELSETLRQVKRAYYGFSGPSDINMPKGFFNKVKYYIKNNPLKIISGVVIVGFLIILSL